jgi:hypothetical protein
MHVLLYGLFFLSMLPALVYPFISVWMQEFIGQVFSEKGSLDYVGEAYASGDIAGAAFATWLNNYIVQTVGLTFALSLVIPLAGVLKTAASFAFAGLGITPIWSGMPGMLTYHSITMVLELEAYIYACVAVCAFWTRLIRGLAAPATARAAGAAAKSLGSATLLAGLMLGVAAAYEAATLILLR